jgi:type I restriction enzyme S subunit
MKSGWRRKALSDLVVVASGQVNPSEAPFADMPHVGGDNIESHTGRIVNVSTARQIGMISGKYAFTTDDVLYSKIRPNLNKVATPDFAGICSADIYPLRPKPDAVCREFLVYLLRSDDFLGHAEKHSARTNIPKLNREALLAYEANVQPLPEQKRIAGILDKADALRRKRQQALQLTEQFLRSTFLDMFGDPVANEARLPVKEMIALVDRLRPISYGILKPGPDVKDGVPYVRVLDIQNGTVLSHQIRRTTLKIANEYRRSTIEPGDLLLSIRGHVGRMGFVPEGLSGANITQDTARLAISDPELAAYVYWCLNSVAMQRWMARHVKGVAVQGINLGDVKRIPVPIPRKNLLHKFFSIQSRARGLLLRSKTHSEAANSLFHSLVQRAFRGEL